MLRLTPSGSGRSTLKFKAQPDDGTPRVPPCSATSQRTTWNGPRQPRDSRGKHADGRPLVLDAIIVQHFAPSLRKCKIFRTTTDGQPTTRPPDASEFTGN